MAQRVRVGVVGWNYPEWKGLVYPDDAKPDQFLRIYASKFPIVESAASYYGMPKTETVQRWADETPADFTMSAKVPDWILKKKMDDPDLERALGVFVEHMQPLAKKGKLGMLVAQFPPFFRREKKAEELAAFVAKLPKGAPWAVELRHHSWWDPATYDVLSAAGVTLVWSALGGEERTPPVLTNDVAYLRIFGDRVLEEPYDKKRRDGRAELELWASRIQNEAAKAKRVDVLVSKYLEGYAPGSVATLCEILGIPVPDIGSAEGRTGDAPPKEKKTKKAAKPKSEKGAGFETSWRF